MSLPGAADVRTLFSIAEGLAAGSMALLTRNSFFCADTHNRIAWLHHSSHTLCLVSLPTSNIQLDASLDFVAGYCISRTPTRTLLSKCSKHKTSTTRPMRTIKSLFSVRYEQRRAPVIVNLCGDLFALQVAFWLPICFQVQLDH